MKARIITIYDPKPNYGNRLQNYAVQEVLKKLGFKVKTYCFEKATINFSFYLKRFLKLLLKDKIGGDTFFWTKATIQYLNFKKFNKKYIDTITISSLEKIYKDSTDFYVLGSDQVWNPEWYNGIKKDMFLLTFACPEQKVCLAPSFGVTEIPKEWEEFFKTQLKTFPKISVREKAGAKIIKDLTGREAELVIDPTLMLNATEWLKICNKPNHIDFSKPYIFTYFLGVRSERVNLDIERIANENGFCVYNLFDRNQPELYALGPSEFIYMINNADLIMTDSFHACVFSFLLNKPFLVYKRECNLKDMFSRIDSFLEKFELRRKYVDSGLANNVLESDYSKGFKILKYEKEKAIDFLKTSMGLDSEDRKN